MYNEGCTNTGTVIPAAVSAFGRFSSFVPRLIPFVSPWSHHVVSFPMGWCPSLRACCAVTLLAPPIGLQSFDAAATVTVVSLGCGTLLLFPSSPFLRLQISSSFLPLLPTMLVGSFVAVVAVLVPSLAVVVVLVVVAV
jgi:hypothetical protein